MTKSGRTAIFGGAFLVESMRFDDARGTFFEAHRENQLSATFVQGNISVSKKSVVRGLHYQVKHPQGKLLRTLHGRTFNAIVDMRSASPTLGKAFTITLDRPELGLWVPPGFANGFAALQDDTVTSYHVTTYYEPQYDRALFAFDSALSIPWPAGLESAAIMSDKDRTAPRFSEAERMPS
jgi:dTDP-4-dehydrorhamnose 3,5-epimerase